MNGSIMNGRVKARVQRLKRVRVRWLSRMLLAALFLFPLYSCSLDFDEIFNKSSDSDTGSVPAAPTGLTASPRRAQVTIEWKAVAGASSYNLYWSETRGVTESTGTKISGVQNPYVHAGLVDGATYYYIVTAVNAVGESSRSEEIAVTVNEAPSAPTGVTAAAGNSQVVITWSPVEKATTYSIYWSNTPGLRAGGGNEITDVTSPYIHSGLNNGASYYYVVTAGNDYGESNASSEVSAIPRTDPGNARVRIVWVQDVGDGSDFSATGNNLRLMGLDSWDGQGERVISATVGNYAKPLITPRGDRVVYTDRVRKKVYLLNWDGSGWKELFGGFGLAVWQDPSDGREWIYYGLDETKDEHVSAVYRTPLDNPGSGELIWNKTSVSVDSFQLSADGQMAGGNFPWPYGGVAALPNQSWAKLGSGCWASLSPDNSYLFWLLDDSHRNISITESSGENGRTVNLSNAPGIDGYSVYHPRWSNHPLIMAMTGPYKVKSGPEVEIFVGLFNSGFSAVESWWRVTDNDFADFFPDVWVSP